jgi:alginate O-acetyltransferase complex protein AlgI
MLFNSEAFIFVFLPATLAGFYLLNRPATRRLAVGWLVLASAVFYAWFSVKYLLVLALLIIFNFIYGAKLARAHAAGRQNPLELAVGLAVNLAILAYFKYTNFVIFNLNVAFNTHFVLQNIILPIGISFFTFQKIAYLVDCYRGEAEEYNFLDFSLFVMFFPQLIAGPIVHHKEFIPQLRGRIGAGVSATDMAAGLTLFTFGLLKKTLIADPLAGWSDQMFAIAKAGQAQNLLESWTAALAFTFQIYFDFSGYTDMALGLALMVGIRLPLNFNSPYKALSIIEFWRCWHMTLSRFLRDYIYIPLGGNRRGSSRRYINLMTTMLIGGLWHGAAWTFVVWGGLHGLYLIVNHGWQNLRSRFGLTRTSNAATRWAARVVTFVAVVLAWVFFRAETFGSAATLLQGMLGLHGISQPNGYVVSLEMLMPVLRALGVEASAVTLVLPLRLVVLIIVMFGVWSLPNSQQILAQFRPACEPVERKRLARPLSVFVRLGVLSGDGGLALTPVTGFLTAGALLGAVLYQALRSTTLQQFIYFQF